VRVVGIDYGEARIGIAVSDMTGTIAGASKVLKRSGSEKRDIAKLAEIIREYNGVGEVVVGLPKTLRGEIGVQAEKVMRFVSMLEKNLDIPVRTWDERMTTSAAEKVLIDAGMSRGKRRAVIDKSAAAYMLQGYLDAGNKK